MMVWVDARDVASAADLIGAVARLQNDPLPEEDRDRVETPEAVSSVAYLRPLDDGEEVPPARGLGFTAELG